MSTSPITNETSLQNRPVLRWALIATWFAVVAYTLTVLGLALSPQITAALNSSITQTLLGIPTLLNMGFEYGVDILLILGFSVIGGVLIVHRSDDWFAIFTSLFLITFGVRITSLANSIALMPGYEMPGGLILAMGDIGIVLFMMLFPDGKFALRWFKFTVPLLVATMLGIYIFPGAPFFWNKLGSGVYLSITTTWYVISFLASIHRYTHATLAQKQQIRWVFIGALGPFLWFFIFEILQIFIPALSGSTIFAASFQIIARLLSIFMFLMLPLFIAISIARTKLFDIDLIINRSLVYGILTIGLGLTFATTLGLISLIFKQLHQGNQSLLVATIFSVSAGALFQPARKKLQRFVDHVFYHIQIDYQKTPAEKARATSESIITGTTLSSYHDLKLIGRGGMAEVYRARSPKRGRIVAIKVLRATLADDEQFRRRFMREAEIVSGLEHPNIVRVIDFGDENGAYYIVMEYLSGPDLSNLLKEEKRIDLPRTIILLRDVAAALDYAHQNGLVHRDIKPSNVMLDSSTAPERVVLTDFGIAKISDAHTRITATGMLGTFDYIAPEQIQASADVDGRADVYALGVMTYQMLTGRLPFERPNTGALLLAHLNSPPPDARELIRDLPRRAAHTLQKAMAKKPMDRYATAGEFVTMLESA
jgi:tRNA A-37 threonylcarbamoyl transferase component Bud32